jgi:hypothetical protein
MRGSCNCDRRGIGKINKVVSVAMFIDALKNQTASKLSFPDRRFRLACWIVFGIVATYGTWAVVSGFLNCVPVAKFWNRNISGSVGEDPKILEKNGKFGKDQAGVIERDSGPESLHDRGSV